MKIMGMPVNGLWLAILKDNSKWVIDFDNNMFDNYKWYKAYGTLESELNWEDLKKEIESMKKISKD